MPTWSSSSAPGCSDFTTASKTAFAADNVRFVAINVAELDAHKHAALPLIGDARVTLEELRTALGSWSVAPKYDVGDRVAQGRMGT